VQPQCDLQGLVQRLVLDRDVDAVLQPMVQAFNSGDFDAMARL
jgi:hypothetical protein